MNKIILIIMSLAIIGGLAWYFDQNYVSKSSSSSNTSVTTVKAPPAETAKLGKTTNQKLIFASQTNQGAIIASVTATGENQKTLFTYADETEKIKETNIFSPTTFEAPLIVGNNRLASVKLDGSGKKEILIDSLGNPPSVNLSPDGKLISFVAFSNVEVDYGYTLYVSSRKGEGLRELTRNEKEIKNPIWGADNTKIYYLQISDNQTAIMKIDLETSRSQSIYQTENYIYSLNFSAGKLIFSSGPKGKNVSAIYQINGNGQNLEKLLEDNGVIYYPFLSVDSLNLAYLISAEAIDDPSGDILVASADGKNKQKITKGNKILGWIN